MTSVETTIPTATEGPPVVDRRARLARRLRLAGGVMVGATAVAVSTVLAGWILAIPTLTGQSQGAAIMTAGTALVLAAASVAVGMQWREGLSLSPSRGLIISAGTAGLLALWSLLEFSTGWSLGIDAVLAASPEGAAAVSGTPALLPMLGTVLLIGATMLASHPARYGATQVLAVGTIAVAMFDGTGQLLAVPAVAVAGTPGVMAGPAAMGLFMLSFGLLLSQPDRGLVRVALEPGPGGSTVRRYLPAIVAAPMVMGWLIWLGVSAGAYPAPFGAALLVTLCGLVPAGLLLRASVMPVVGVAMPGAMGPDTDAHLRRAVAGAPVPMVVHDGDTVLAMNPAWADVAGADGLEVKTISAWVARVQPDEVDRLPAFRARLAEATGVVDDGEQVLLAADGGERVWQMSSTPLSQPGAGRRLFATMAVDVTERKAAEAALRQATEDLDRRSAERTAALTRANDALKRQSEQLREQALLLDLVREGILVRDLYGTIVYWNHGAATMYGWPKEQALGKVSHQLLAAEYPLPVADIEAEVMRAGFWEGDVVYVTRSGTRLMVESRWTLTRTERGKPEGFLEVHRDITQRREAERALRAKNEALARSNHELEQFAYVASHDLQEPLRMVSNYTQLLARRYRDRLDSDANEFIDFAVDGAKRMQELIHDLLQYARVERRGREFQPVQAETIVNDALANLAGAIGEAEASIVVDPLPTLTCDSSQMGQVFQNLIGNAIKFRRPDQSPVVRISAVREERAWRLSVADNGIGIEPRYFERIFHMFQRLHARGEYEGTGIGLALCKKIVERHGGQIRVESAARHGSTFSFTVPDAGAPS